MTASQFISPLGHLCLLIREGDDYVAFKYLDTQGGFTLSRANLKIMKAVH